jgi:hypothetical protein
MTLILLSGCYSVNDCGQWFKKIGSTSDKHSRLLLSLLDANQIGCFSFFNEFGCFGTAIFGTKNRKATA